MPRPSHAVEGSLRETTGYRLVHAEGDGAPSLICDRYDRWLVVQLLSAGLEACRSDIVEALVDIALPAGILARNDAAVRRKEGLATTVEVLAGDVPREIEATEHGVDTLQRPGTVKKPAPSSINARTGRSSRRSHAAARWIVSAITGRSRSTSPGKPRR